MVEVYGDLPFDQRGSLGMTVRCILRLVMDFFSAQTYVYVSFNEVTQMDTLIV
jgi:hypothetical protein